MKKVKWLLPLIMLIIISAFSSCENNTCQHIEVIDTGIAPTCIESGKTDGKHCSVCGDILVKQESINALGHK